MPIVIPRHWKQTPNELTIVCDYCQQKASFMRIEHGNTLNHFPDGRWGSGGFEVGLCESSPTMTLVEALKIHGLEGFFVEKGLSPDALNLVAEVADYMRNSTEPMTLVSEGMVLQMGRVMKTGGFNTE